VSAIFKGVLAVVAVSSIVLLAFPMAAAQTPSLARAKDCMAGTWTDSFGSGYTFSGKSGACAASYPIKGDLVSEVGTPGLPWKITGHGAGTSVSFTVHASKTAKAQGYCSYSVSLTVSGTPPTETATGSYANAAPCTGSGSISFTQDTS
jgi:hypothetical protein